MADGTLLNVGSGGDTIYDKDNGDGSKTPAGLVVVSTSAPYKTLASPATPLPVQLSQGNAVLSAGNPLPMQVATYPTPTAFSALAAVTAVAKASAGSLKSVKAYNANAADRWLQLHNLAAAPSGGAVPFDTIRLPAGQTVVLGTDFFTNGGMPFSTGVTIAISTTRGTYTAATAADHDISGTVQ